MLRQILFSGIVTIALLAGAATAPAQIPQLDAACRAAIHKNAGKLGTTAMKTIDGCVKSVLAGKLLPGTNCNSLATADSRGKVEGAKTKLRDGVSGKCSSPDNAGVIAVMAQCPSPADASDSGGATNGVDNFSELAECEIDINTDTIESLRRYILAPNASAILAHPDAKAISKCANAIGKGATKLWSTVSKERGKCQTDADSAGGPYAYGCSLVPIAKITDATAKLEASIDKSCGDLLLTAGERGLIGTCDSSVFGIKACVVDAVLHNAGGATATAFEFAGECPTEATVTVNAGTGPGSTPSAHLNRSFLDTGWNGLGHDQDFADHVYSAVNLSCSSGDCSSCTLTANCEQGNCRCSHNSAILCSIPFVSGGPCGANTCLVHTGPPQALSAGASPVCVVNTILTELVGTADAGTGEVNALLHVQAKIHFGLTQYEPCPTCSGAGVGSAGTCSGGSRNGLACTTNAVDAAFGNTSYDCPPSLATNITGSGAKLDLNFSSGAVSLPFGDSCDAPYGALACACGACSGDSRVGCNSDAECAGLGLGTCSNSGGSPRQPNACDDLTCTSNGAGEGTCSAGPTDLYCDGLLKGDGDGIVTCVSTAECTSIAAGTCALSKQRECYLNPIAASGSAGTAGAELVAVACHPPTSNAGVNYGFGWPGADRMKLDLDFDLFCSDGTTPFELGGSNCP